MRAGLLFFLIVIGSNVGSQELYVFSEPASNIPGKSISLKLTDHVVNDRSRFYRVSHRVMPQVYAGISKKIMLQAGATLANMHTPNFRYESSNIYIKYRFLSRDDVHKHFRMAMFADASKTSAPFHYEEVTLMGDKSGVEAGVIATQLTNRFALSATVSHTQVLDSSRFNSVLYIPKRNYQAFNYSLSGGFLLLPKEYTSYKQTNLNLYLELLCQQSLDTKHYFIDAAPAVQLIFNSNAKLNLGYRFQLGGDMDRMTRNSWLISFERTLLNAFGNRN